MKINRIKSEEYNKNNLYNNLNRSNLLILSLVGVVIISCIVLTSFSAFSSIDNGKNSISITADVKDKIPPTCESIVGESSTWTNSNRQISVVCNDNKECEKGVYITTYDTTTKTASVTIKDKAGNTATCLINVYVDKQAPTCGTITGASTTWTKDNRTVSITCSDSDSTCTKTSFSNTFSTTVASNGVGYITIRDVAGNTATCPVNVYVDKTAPSCGSKTGASTTWTNSNRTISVACSDTNSKCSKTSFSNTFSTTAQTANITISDNAGNSTNCPVNVYVDKTGPTCGTVTGASTTWTNSNRTISVACSDTNSKCTKSSFSNTYSKTAQTANITITDNAGNSTNCPVNVYVDKTKPTCGSVTGASTTWTKDNRTISVACSDSHSKCSKTSFSNTFSTTAQTSNITISDNVGNTTSCPVNVYVDKTAPTCGSITGASTSWTTSDRTISVACSDSHSKCSSASFSKTFNVTTQTGYITISDNVGNTTSCAVNAYVDKTDYSISASQTTGGSISLSASSAKRGSTITIYATGSTSGCGGYSYNGATVKNAQTGAVYASLNSSTTTFTMPAYNVTVTPSWTQTRTYIYNNGSQCYTISTNMTGGGSVGTNPYIDLNAIGGGSQCGSAYAYASVNLAPYNTLYFDVWYPTRPGSSNSILRLGAATKTFPDMYSGSGWSNNNAYSYTFARQTIGVNVSNITATVYVTAGLSHSTPDCGTTHQSRAYIYAIWGA